MFYQPIIKYIHGYKRLNGVDRYGKKQFIHRGGGFKYLALILDCERFLSTEPGLVVNIFFYKKTRRVIACVAYGNGYVLYTPSWHGNKVGSWVFNGVEVPVYPGNRCFLGEVPKGASFYHLAKNINSKVTFIKAKGTVGIVLKKVLNWNLVKMPSGEERVFDDFSMVTLGRLAWLLHHKRVLSKAGRNRQYGRRPVVRGVAKNPIDHPHGGGEGRTSGGRPSSTPWGVYTKGKKTRKRKLSKFVMRSCTMEEDIILF